MKKKGVKKILKKKNNSYLVSFFENQYEKSFSYIKESKKYIYWTIGVFFLFSLVGFFVPVPSSFSELIMDYLKELVLETQGMSYGELMNYLFFHNSYSSFMGLFFGVFFGLFPLFSVVANGFLVGYVSSLSVSVAGFSVLVRLVPHGIFELPALFISLGLGIKLGTFILRKEKIKSLGNFLLESLRVFVFIVLPLLVLAAIIEGTLIYYF